MADKKHGGGTGRQDTDAKMETSYSLLDNRAKGRQYAIEKPQVRQTHPNKGGHNSIKPTRVMTPKRIAREIIETSLNIPVPEYILQKIEEHSMWKKDPFRTIEIFLYLMEFSYPKLARVQVDANVTQNAPDAEERFQMLKSLLMNSIEVESKDVSDQD
jgi:hypothetical protein